MNNARTDRTSESKRTIVGGRPRGRRQGRGGIPRVIEVLIKKASLDPAFCQLLVEQRAEAAAELELELAPAERAILDAVPEAQLKSMIEGTKVPEMQRRAFLGQIGAAMLAAVTAGCNPPTATIKKQVEGIRPEDEATSTPAPEYVEKEVISTKILGHTVEVTATFTPAPPNTPTAASTVSSVQPEPEDTGTPSPEHITWGIRPDRP